MKKFLFIAVIGLASLPVFGQKVEVTQQYIDDSTRAFREVTLSRIAIAALQRENESHIKRIALLEQQHVKDEERIEVRDAQIEKWKALKCEETEIKFIVVYRKKKCQ